MLSIISRPAEAKVHIVEPLVALRSSLIDLMRQHGFVQVMGFGDLRTMIDHLEVEQSDWILSASCLSNDVNILHILKLCATEPRLFGTRISFLARDHEREILPYAFELGLFSYHFTTVPSQIPEAFSDLFRMARDNNFSSTLIAADYLRRILRETRRWDLQIQLEKTLLETFPGSVQVLMSMAEAELSIGREEGHQTLHQVLLIDPNRKDEIDQIRQRFVSAMDPNMILDIETPLSSPSTNALGIHECAVIDPDTTVHHQIHQALIAVGLQRVECFESGAAAWKWLSGNGKPSLILLEWKIPGLAGLQLVQRIRQHNPTIPMIVISSLIGVSEEPLLKEIGVNGFVPKPFETQDLLAEIITVLQQSKYPTEQASMDRKIKQCLQAGNKAEASRLMGIYLANPSYDEIGKLKMEAEYAFCEGQYQTSCKLAMDALRMSHDSVELLNILGKALMKLGDFENALRCLEKADALAPKNIERLCNLAEISSDLGQREQADRYLQEAKGIDAGNIIVLETEAAEALESNDIQRASEAMRSMDNLHRIVAFTNNKAVAKIRNNKFEEGIQLYCAALDALPMPWCPIHDTICFNLALAYIRFMEYPKAKEALEKIRAQPGSMMHQKVAGILQKINHALKTNSQLHFSVDGKPPAPAGKPEPGSSPLSGHSKEFDASAMIDSITPTRGDICCYRIFTAADLATDAIRKLSNNVPRLTSRPPIRRSEVMAKMDQHK